MEARWQFENEAKMNLRTENFISAFLRVSTLKKSTRQKRGRHAIEWSAKLTFVLGWHKYLIGMHLTSEKQIYQPNIFLTVCRLFTRKTWTLEISKSKIWPDSSKLVKITLKRICSSFEAKLVNEFQWPREILDEDAT